MNVNMQYALTGSYINASEYFKLLAGQLSYSNKPTRQPACQTTICIYVCMRYAHLPLRYIQYNQARTQAGREWVFLPQL